ncbi:MAG TPA: metallophosphoesterase [Methanotrichaceae archaeon]|nr:metallophosphoesterase [Methanotrichaceae archaeon]HQF16691.1 metallophosphoesterase [Methanotrichaceae archaeon]HQI91297.1 metallophosphoesterase [Methanotrichaceae archaeon]HQJ28711.1 metallophosphoesterase [Methanotrichaceae archaeon]
MPDKIGGWIATGGRFRSIVVISDTHFGGRSATLCRESRVDYLIWEIWRYGDGFDELVLLGDVLDLWRARPEQALRQASYLFRRLAELDVPIRYVVGNHDHHMMVMRQERALLDRMARGDLFSIYYPHLSWSQTIDGLKLDMAYPTYTASVGDRRFLFTHGHHLNGVQALSLQVVENLRRLSGEPVSPADLERLMTYAYESIYRSSYVGEFVELEERIWKASTVLDRVRSGIRKTFRFIPVERHYGSILEFMHERQIGPVDCFVYGDTHRPDIFKKGKGPLVANAGCFSSENVGPNDPVNTYLVLQEDRISLRQLGLPEPLASFCL